MHLDPVFFVVMPTRIANMVHYLTHGRTLPNIIPDKEAFERAVATLQIEAHKAEWRKVK